MSNQQVSTIEHLANHDHYHFVSLDLVKTIRVLEWVSEESQLTEPLAAWRQSIRRTSQGKPDYIFSNTDVKMPKNLSIHDICNQYNVALKVFKSKRRILISHIQSYNVKRSETLHLKYVTQEPEN